MPNLNTVPTGPEVSLPESLWPATPAARQIVTVTHQLKRLDWSVLGEATLGAFSLEKGFGYTLWRFLRWPRASFEAYLGADRLRFSNPFKIVLLLTAATTFASYQFDMFGGYTAPQADPSQVPAAASAAEFFQRNYNLVLLGALPLMALVSRVLYWRRAYNFVEHLALNAFIFAVTTVCYLLTLLPTVLWPKFGLVYAVVSVGYQTWVYRRVLGPGWMRAISTSLLTLLVYLIVVALVASVVVILKT